MFKLSSRLFLGLILLSAAGAPAATLTSLKLTPDGSAKPPGDRLEFSVVFGPNENTVKLEIRALVRRADAAPEDLPARAKGKNDFLDEKGDFRIVRNLEIEKAAEFRSQDVTLTIPYEGIDLADGEYRLFYEIHGEATAPFDSITDVTLVSVGGGVRRSMNALVAVKEKEETEGFRIVEGEKPFGEKVQIPKEYLRSEEVEVEIPQQFKRTDVKRLSPDIKKSEPRPTLKKTIYFATNRSTKGGGTGTARLSVNNNFTNAISNTLTYGNCQVQIPIATHKRGELEVASWWKNDPNTVFLIDALASLSRDLFVEALAKEDVLLFVHGYNNDFRDAILQTAQLAQDIRFAGRALTFSWPSQGETAEYGEDETMAAKSHKALEQVIKDLLAKGGERKVHILAHSMGNRILVNALRNLETSGFIKKGEKRFANIVLAAPDVDINEFGSLAPTLVRQAARVTFYYSRKDMALDLSERIHVMNRAGLFPFFAEGMDTVNADGGNEEWVRMRHSYYASSNKLLTDLLLLFNRSLDPKQRRPPLDLPEKMLGFDHWKFKLG